MKVKRVSHHQWDLITDDGDVLTGVTRKDCLQQLENLIKRNSTKKLETDKPITIYKENRKRIKTSLGITPL